MPNLFKETETGERLIAFGGNQLAFLRTLTFGDDRRGGSIFMLCCCAKHFLPKHLSDLSQRNNWNKADNGWYFLERKNWAICRFAISEAFFWGENSILPFIASVYNWKHFQRKKAVEWSARALITSTTLTRYQLSLNHFAKRWIEDSGIEISAFPQFLSSAAGVRIIK